MTRNRGPGTDDSTGAVSEDVSDDHPGVIRGALGINPDYDDEDLRLIEVASSVLAERGIRGTSTDDIARAAGVTRVTLYRRLGTRDELLRAIYAYEAQRLILSVRARFTPFSSLEWDPVQHIEDLLVGTVFDIRDSELVRRVLEVDKPEALAVLAGESGTVLGGITEIVAEYLRNTWNADVHTRVMDDDEADRLALEVGSVVGRFLHSLVVMPDGPPRLDSEGAIRRLARRVLVPMILQR